MVRIGCYEVYRTSRGVMLCLYIYIYTYTILYILIIHIFIYNLIVYIYIVYPDNPVTIPNIFLGEEDVNWWCCSGDGVINGRFKCDFNPFWTANLPHVLASTFPSGIKKPSWRFGVGLNLVSFVGPRQTWWLSQHNWLRRGYYGDTMDHHLDSVKARNTVWNIAYSIWKALFQMSDSRNLIYAAIVNHPS